LAQVTKKFQPFGHPIVYSCPESKNFRQIDMIWKAFAKGDFSIDKGRTYMEAMRVFSHMDLLAVP